MNNLESFKFYIEHIIESIKSNDYMRLFIGIDHPGTREAVIGHVLGDPDNREISSYELSYKNAVRANENTSHHCLFA